MRGPSLFQAISSSKLSEALRSSVESLKESM
jgi:hypothetical protein